MVIKCKMCGGDLPAESQGNVAVCEYCGSRQTIPTADNEKKMLLFARANRLRFGCEFDKAAGIYESIVAEFPEEAEAYWGLVLCKYGIEYVDDPATGSRIPTCHRSSFDSVMEDTNFEQACENADAVSRRIYRDEAKGIEELRKGIIEISGKEEPYDIFICYKETDENGSRTLDSVLAQDIYDALTEKGYRVFFSRITLEDKLGTEYEPYIFAALNSAKVMLAVGTDYEYYNAVWVKNEWGRYLQLMSAGQKKYLIPCYKNLDAYDMPKEFARLQAQDLGKVGAMQDLLRGIEKLVGGNAATDGNGQAENAVVQTVVQLNAASDALTERGYLFLEDGEFNQANTYFERALDANPKDAKAYFGKVLASQECKTADEMKEDVSCNRDYQRAVQYAADDDRVQFEAVAERTRLAAEEKAKEEKYDAAVAAMQNSRYAAAAHTFGELGGFGDSEERLRECIERYRKQLVDREASAAEEVDRLEAALRRSGPAIIQKQNAKADAERESCEIQKKLQSLGDELSQVRGLFTGVKQKRLKSDMMAWQQILRSRNDKLEKLDEEIAAAESERKKMETYLSAAQAALFQAKENTQKIEKWTDREIVDAMQREEEEKKEKWSVGKKVVMGHYGGEAIEWLVLDADGGKRTMIAVKGQDAVPFNKSKADGNEWQTSYVRTWLNDTFWNAAFSEGEKAMIVPGATGDKVWLLSIAEAERYFVNGPARICYATAYAKGNGVYTIDSGACRWWLRSPSNQRDSGTTVNRDGNVISLFNRVGINNCVRPVVVALPGL